MKPYDYYEIKTPWYGNEPHKDYYRRSIGCNNERVILGVIGAKDD